MQRNGNVLSLQKIINKKIYQYGKAKNKKHSRY